MNLETLSRFERFGLFSEFNFKVNFFYRTVVYEAVLGCLTNRESSVLDF